MTDRQAGGETNSRSVVVSVREPFRRHANPLGVLFLCCLSQLSQALQEHLPDIRTLQKPHLHVVDPVRNRDSSSLSHTGKGPIRIRLRRDSIEGVQRSAHGPREDGLELNALRAAPVVGGGAPAVHESFGSCVFCEAGDSKVHKRGDGRNVQDETTPSQSQNFLQLSNHKTSRPLLAILTLPLSLLLDLFQHSGEHRPCAEDRGDRVESCGFCLELYGALGEVRWGLDLHQLHTGGGRGFL
mmetsp:Transcript_4594/g.9218  ORF Transcript_4594/g.9218 Transcript_4594/m.9218 type:complete len:241 (+) Transcript_4594:2737-3459(+)